jgi:hypothetical protein
MPVIMFLISLTYHFLKIQIFWVWHCLICWIVLEIWRIEMRHLQGQDVQSGTAWPCRRDTVILQNNWKLLTQWHSIAPQKTLIFSNVTVRISSLMTLRVVWLNLGGSRSLKCWDISAKLHMSHPVMPIIFRWRYECELFDLQEATVLSLDFSTHLYILSCTLTTCWLLWDHSTRNTSGGRSTSLLSRWLVASLLIKCDFYCKLQSLNIPCYFHDICLAFQQIGLVHTDNQHFNNFIPI